MSEGEPEPPDGPRGLDGLPIGDAAALVVSRGDAEDYDSASYALQEVTEDGHVSADALDDALAHLSKVVSTPETRLELAEMALEEARAAAEPVADVDAVAARLEGFEARLEAVGSRIEALGADLFEAAREVRRVREEANTLQGAADELQVDLEEFEEWLADPGVRVDELEADLDAVEEMLAGLGETAEALRPEEGGSPVGSTTAERSDPGTQWASATVDHRVAGLLLADVRAELADLRTLAERADGGEAATDPLDAVADRLDELEGRHEAVGEALASIDAPVWHDRFEERIATVEETLESFEPPVDWAALQSALEGAEGGATDRTEAPPGGGT